MVDVDGNTSSSSQQPRSAANPGMHSMLAAAIGLTSLGAPSSPTESSPTESSPSSPTESSPSSSERGVSKKPLVEATKDTEAIPVTQVMENPLFMDTEFLKPYQALAPPLKKPIDTTTMPLPTIMAAPPAQPPAYLNNLQPPYPAAVIETALPSAFESSLPWSSIHPSPATAGGFASLRQQLLDPHSGTPFSDAARDMSHFFVGERIAAMDLPAAVATASAPLALPSPFTYYPPYPNMSGASFPLIPTAAHQKIIPIPNTKNFPETLFDVISSDENQHIISWLHHGKGFVVHDKQRFALMILPRYFDGAKFTSFTRRLKRWSYVRVPRGPELGAYYNKNFMRDQPELVQKMRYRMDGQFEDGKKKSSDDKDEQYQKLEDERLEEQIEKEVGAKIQAGQPKKEAAVTNASPMIMGQKEYETQTHQVMQNHLLANKLAPEIERCFLNPQERPMPLPSTLPKRPKKTDTGTRKTNRNVARGMLGETLINHSATNAESSLLPRGHPDLVSPNDPLERQLIEMQRELLLSRSMLSHDVATGRSTNSLGPTSSSSTFMGMNMSNHHNYTTAPDTSQRMLDMERANRIFEAERILNTESILRCRDQIANNNDSGQELMASKIIASSKAHDETMDVAIMDAAVRNLKSRLAPGIRSSEAISANSIREQMNTMLPMSYSNLAKMHQGPNALISNPRPNQQFDAANGLGETRRTTGEAHSGGGGARPIMMTREEEEGFAQYMVMQMSRGAHAA
eukprot:CAMPEP_0172302750 /NCGR_PEP_ID=MMETSP1058-20130122/4410_1 /TAXON_ID=83371 /ORGANISM="Detonula confervacea, Strain CCMP 353" /LENGTH=742 /DNA_ID=CAMNT_0013013345 /DNA_START=33 /DNA_END=2261 /DNA_ORIENTATION=-